MLYLRVAQIVGESLQLISSELVLIKQYMIMCWATCSLHEQTHSN